TKQLTTLVTEGWGHVLTNWDPYALVVTGLIGLFLIQSSFHAGPITASQATLTIVDPVMSVVIGIWLFHDHLDTAQWRLPVELVAMGIVVFGVIVLSRSPLVAGVKDESSTGDKLVRQPKSGDRWPRSRPAAHRPVAAQRPAASTDRTAWSISAWAKANPRVCSTSGSTRWPPSTSSVAISDPSASRSAAPGTASTTGRCRAAPNAVASSASVAGWGAVALTGPDSPASSMQARMTETSSSRVIQLRYWCPEPMRPPSPSRKSGSCLPSTPPSALRTMPVRRSTVRIPASTDGAAAASQSEQTSARNPLPGADRSVSTSSPRSP